MPAVQAARESSRRISCVNNLKTLGLASHLYHDSYQTFPPGATGPLTPAFPQYANLRHHALGTFLLPFLEQRALATHYRWESSWFAPANQPVINTHLAVWQCPSAPQHRLTNGTAVTVVPPPHEPFAGTAACSDYAGMGSVDSGLVRAGVITPPPAGPRDERGHYEGVFAVNASRSLSDVRDGASHTILIAECAGRPALWQRGRQIPETWLSGGPWASRNLLWTRGASADGDQFFGPCAVNCTNDREIYSFHAGGANAVLADGSVHFVNAAIDIRTLASLATRAGGEVSPSEF